MSPKRCTASFSTPRYIDGIAFRFTSMNMVECFASQRPLSGSSLKLERRTPFHVRG